MTGFFLGNSEVALAAETVNSETVSEVASVDETELKDNDSEVTTASEEALSEESSVESPVTAEVAEESNSEVAEEVTEEESVDDLADYKAQAKGKINALENLNANELAAEEALIDQATSTADIDKIVENAEVLNAEKAEEVVDTEADAQTSEVEKAAETEADAQTSEVEKAAETEADAQTSEANKAEETEEATEESDRAADTQVETAEENKEEKSEEITTFAAASAEEEDASTSNSNIINVDAIESGKITSGRQFQTTPGIVSGWLDVATNRYTPGINGSETALNGYKVYLQWMDEDGITSPVYEAMTHDIGGTRAGQGGNGVYAFDIGEGWTDATGKLHKPAFQSVGSQRYKLWLAPGQTSSNGNEYFTYRKQPGNSTGFSGATLATGEFVLAGHSIQRTAIYVYEKPNNVTMTTPENEWKYDDEGPDNNPSYLPDGVNKKHRNAVSGQVWWETSRAGTGFPDSAGERFVNQTLEEAKTGFRVVTSVLTAEGGQAMSATNDIKDVNERIRQQQEILAANPQYIQQTVVAPIVGERGRYTARFDDKFDLNYMYQYVIDGDGQVVPGYTGYSSPVFTHPKDYASSAAFIANKNYAYNVHFALVADPAKYNIDITNYDAVNNIAKPGATAISDVFSMFYPGEETEIVWIDSTDGSPVELSRTKVNNLDEARSAAQLTVPDDFEGRKIYTVQLVVNGNIIAADSFAADSELADNEAYEPEVTPVEKDYGEATTTDEVTSAVTVPNFPAEGDQPVITVDDPSQLPDGKTPGEYEVDVTVTYPDGTTDTVKVPVTVGEQAQNEAYEPEVTPVEKDYGQATTADDVTSSVTVPNFPTEGDQPVITVDEPSQLPDGTTPGEYLVDVTVTYPDGTTDKVQVPVTVGKQAQNEAYEPEVTPVEKDYGEATTTEEVTSSVTVPNFPTEGDQPVITVEDPSQLPDGKTPGEYEVDVTVTYPDGTKDTVKVPVTIGEMPWTPINEAPTIASIEDQTVNESTPITPVIVDATDDGQVTVAVDGLPTGVEFNTEANEISGAPSVTDWGTSEETRDYEVTVTATDEEGAVTTETFIITVQRDTDGDGDPDVTDPDDDNDGYTDEEEKEAGTDPKDPDSKPSEEDTTGPVISPIEDQTVIEGDPIKPIVVETDEEATIEVDGLPDGVEFDPETGEISGTPEVTWNGDEETRDHEVTVTATDKDGNTSTETVVITVERDTDGDGDPDVTDPDDDNDGYTDEEEKEAGTDPKDPNSKPSEEEDTTGPVISPIEDQTVVEGNPIKPIVVETDEEATIEVDGLPDGVEFDPETGEISGTPEVTWDGNEETRDIEITITATDKDGNTSTETVVITVERDTDGDGEPDVTDPDDDNDGYTDEEEKEAGTDPKDPNSFPSAKVDHENDEVAKEQSSENIEDMTTDATTSESVSTTSNETQQSANELPDAGMASSGSAYGIAALLQLLGLGTLFNSKKRKKK